ncbi:Type II secretion system protein F [Jeotgalibaca dankookensis]|uniref:Type II secretion system protein F n=2 Tax=Jeotgalibaca dankookensis TaxID=708126 RepID=A0A1S6IP34_9LACT|nr:Type II secretion system protein F [Jeotgalibaca dankookensis]
MDMAILLKKILKTTSSFKHWRPSVQAKFLTRLAELISEGFSLGEALKFLQIMMPKQKENLVMILSQLESGQPFSQTIGCYGFPKSIVTQLELSNNHGSFTETLFFCADYIETIRMQKEKLQKVMIYPLFLIALSTGMLFSVRTFMLPTIQSMKVESDRLTTGIIYFLTYLPHLFLGILSLLLIVIVGTYSYWRDKEAYERASFVIRIPLLGKLAKNYYTFYYCREISYFLLNGLALNQMIVSMKTLEANQLMRELALRMEKFLRDGHTLPHFIESIPFFNKEMSWIIYHGELTSQVGKKIHYYGKTCFQEFTAETEKWIKIIQPVMFLSVGLLVILIYLILMLPMLSMMRGGY